MRGREAHGSLRGRRGDAPVRRGEVRVATEHGARVGEEAPGDGAGAEVAAEPGRPRVVGDESQLDVVERREEAREVADPGANVGDRIEQVAAREPRARHDLAHRRRHELHEPEGARRRDRARIEPRLHVNDGEDEQRVHRGRERFLDDGARHARPLGGSEPDAAPLHLAVDAECIARPHRRPPVGVRGRGLDGRRGTRRRGGSRRGAGHRRERDGTPNGTSAGEQASHRRERLLGVCAAVGGQHTWNDPTGERRVSRVRRTVGGAKRRRERTQVPGYSMRPPKIGPQQR
jgi:hypothetical protein